MHTEYGSETFNFAAIFAHAVQKRKTHKAYHEPFSYLLDSPPHLLHAIAIHAVDCGGLKECGLALLWFDAGHGCKLKFCSHTGGQPAVHENILAFVTILLQLHGCCPQ